MRVFLLGAALALLLAASPAVAGAGTASVVRGTLTYEAAAGEANSVTVTRAPQGYRVADAGATVTAGAGCVPVTPNQVLCDALRVRKIDLRLGDLDDFATASVLARVVARGGAGSDTLEGGEGDDDLLGGEGDDRLEGGVGFDLLDGGLGRDTMSGGTGLPFAFFEFFGVGEEGGGGVALDGADDVPELDAVSYARRTGPVTVTLDGVANDGEAGEADVVLADVEGAIGGSADDTLVGNPLPNFLAGGPGNDMLRGLGGRFEGLFGDSGDDRLFGGARESALFGGSGDDVLSGGPGSDFMRGGAGNDRLNGRGGPNGLFAGPGDDVLAGGSRRDYLAAGGGNDVVLAGDGRDFISARDRMRDNVDGGRGRDLAVVDCRLDRVRRVERMCRTLAHPPLTGRAAQATERLRALVAARVAAQG